MAGKRRRATGNQGQTVNPVEIHRSGQVYGTVSNIVAQRIGDNHRLFGDLFGHEMLIASLFDAGGIDLNAGFGTVGQAVGLIVNRGPLAGDHGPIALVQIGDPVGHGGKGYGI